MRPATKAFRRSLAANPAEESSDEERKAKGVSNLIEIENPNRVQKKTKKLATLNTAELESKPQLSRREREEIEKQKAQAHYQKLHAEGKTEQARADLARLAIIKQQRRGEEEKRGGPERERKCHEGEDCPGEEGARQKIGLISKLLFDSHTTAILQLCFTFFFF
ncbi:hypothetical protein NQ318_002788 [Aromia moschata]|uniref:Casein kinase substrate phosphoprotein PP28 domain-containing protein n=1 Tax=Aromia moschata TaxID=1265417 RepID=A0AAV8XTS7_9CUCU|nr:hypothetical protein NQ318_002788 [Aromia moschata]